jgi:hypothetical protein
MTSEQRSLILDEEYYWDAPEAYKKTLSTVKEQEAGGVKYVEAVDAGYRVKDVNDD